MGTMQLQAASAVNMEELDWNQLKDWGSQWR